MVFIKFNCGFWYYGYGVGIKSSIESRLKNLTVLYRVLFEDFVYVF